KIEEVIVPFAAAADRLDELTGVGHTAARVIIAEIGSDMGRFPTAGQLVSWARFAPGVKESAGKRQGNATTPPPDMATPTLPRCWARPPWPPGGPIPLPSLGQRDRRIARRRGAKRAIVAVGRSILIIIWHLLSAPHAHFHD